MTQAAETMVVPSIWGEDRPLWPMSKTRDLIFFGSAILEAGRQLLIEDFDQQDIFSRKFVGGFLLKQICEGYIQVWLVKKGTASRPFAIDAEFLLAVPIEDITETCAVQFSMDQVDNHTERYWVYLNRAQFGAFLSESHRLDAEDLSSQTPRVTVTDINQRVAEIVLRLDSVICSEVAKELVREIEGQSASENKRRVNSVRSLMDQNGAKKADLIEIRAANRCK